MNARRTLLVGIGSNWGDDQAGWIVADRVAERVGSWGIEVRKAKSPVQLLDWLQDVERLVICDACHGLGRAGTIRRWKWPTGDFPGAASRGTHDLSLPAVLTLAQRLDRLPSETTVWVIEGTRNASGPLSARVAEALPVLVDWILCDLCDGALFRGRACTHSC